MKISNFNPELTSVDENLMIALPNLTNTIDEDIIDLVFSHPRYCSNDVSIQKIYELYYEENQKERLVIIHFTDSEASNKVLMQGDVNVNNITLRPVKFSRELLKALNNKSVNYLQLKLDTFPYNFLSSIKLITELKTDLEQKFDADLNTKPDCYEIKRRPDRLLKSTTSLDTNQEWLNKVNEFLDNYMTVKFSQYEIFNEKLLLNETNWNLLLNTCFSRYQLSDSINIESINTEQPKQTPIITGVRELVEKERLRIENEAKKLNEEEKKQKEKQIYILDTLSAEQCKILAVEKYVEWCKENISSSLEIKINEKSVEFKDNWTNIDKAKSRLWDLVHSIKETKFKIDNRLIEFLKTNTQYLIKFQNDNNLKCLIELTNDYIEIKSINDSTATKFHQLIHERLKVSVYDLSEFSIELIKNSKFNTFIKQKEIEFKETSECDHYLISVYLVKKEVCCAGEKMLVDRLINDVQDFFESNTVYTKEFKENEIELFSHENIKFLKLVKQAEVLKYCEEIKNNLQINVPFQIEQHIVKQHENGFRINNYRVKLTANAHFHDRLLKFLKSLIDKKIQVDFKLENQEQMEVFYDPKIQNIVESLEEHNDCIIMSPLYQDLVKNSNETSRDIIMPIDVSAEESYFTCYFCDTRQASLSPNRIKISVVDADFIQTNANKLDTVIVSIDNKFQGMNNISKVLLNKSGQQVINELRSLSKSEYNYQLYDGIIFITKTGDLKSKSMIHCVLPSDNERNNESMMSFILAIIFKCLEKCEQFNFKRIGFSLIGSNSYKKISNAESIQLHIDTLLDYLSDTVISTCIEEIYLIDDKLNPSLISKLTEISKEKDRIFLDEPVLEIADFKNTNDKKLINTNIEVIYGSITDDSLVCDAIVNSTNTNLQLNSGLVSANILKMAGNSIQIELTQKYPKGLEPSTMVAVSSAGNLKNKKFIFHCCIPAWSTNQVKQLFKNIIFSLLIEANTLNLNSISLPAFGSGNLGYPKNEVPKLMFEALNEYFEEINSNIKVYIVVYQNDAETVKAFQDFLNEQDKEERLSLFDESEWLTQYSDNDTDSNSSTEPKTFYANFTSSENECSINFANVNVKAYIGDIAATENDVVINPTDKELSLAGNISKVLEKTGGDEISTELMSFAKNHDGIVWTTAGFLKCKKIIHVDVRTFETKTAIVKALKEINEKNYSSLTLPVIGTGAIQNDPKDSIRNILNAISIFISLMTDSNKPVKIKQIDICIFKQSVYLNQFNAEMEKRAKLKVNQKDEGFIKKFLNFIMPTKTNLDFQKILNETTINNSIQTGHKQFKLISDDKNKLDQVKNRLKEIAQDEMKTEELKNDYIKKLDAKTRSDIENQCNKEHTKLEWDLHLSRILIKGRPKNILKCYKLIYDRITNYADLKQAKIAAELTAHKIQWEYEKRDKWIPFNIYLNSEIEKKYSSKTDADSKLEIVNEKNEIIIVDVKKLEQFKKADHKSVMKIRRNEIDKINMTIRFPDIWTQNKELDLIDLLKNTSEFKNVLDQIEKSGFISSTHFKRVVSIQRIQNKRLFIQYHTHKDEFLKKYANTQFEQILFHGTNENCVEKIWKNGFNRSYAGKNATVYGKGVYFAKSAQYSHSYTDKRLGSPKGHIFVSKVLVGKVEIGSQNMNVPLTSDTTVDNATSPSIYVIYHDAQAYPEYLFTYE